MKGTNVSSIVVEENGRILMLDRRFPPLGLDLIGGYIDEGETPEEAAIREAKEEANIEVLIEGKICSFKWKNERGSHVEHIFKARISMGKPSDSREGRVKFVPVNDIKKMQLAFPAMMKEFLQYYEIFKNEKTR